MIELAPLNSQTFFCQVCGIGQHDNCPGYHVPRQLSQPGSRQRHFIILSAIAAIGLMVLVVGFWNAG